MCFGGPAEFAFLAAVCGLNEGMDEGDVGGCGDAEVECGHGAGDLKGQMTRIREGKVIVVQQMKLGRSSAANSKGLVDASHPCLNSWGKIKRGTLTHVRGRAPHQG